MRYLLYIGLLLAAAGVQGADRALPALPLTDSTGQTTDLAHLSRGGQWILLVVDPARAHTQAALAKLQWEAGAIDENIVVVAIGGDAAFQAMVKRLGKSSRARFYHDSDGAVPKALHLPGLPAVLGMAPDSQVAWQVIGMPQQADQARSLLASWTAQAGTTQVGR